MRSWSLKIGLDQNVDIYPLNLLQKLPVAKTELLFFKVNFNPLKFTFLIFFWIIMGRIKCSLCFLKK
jgi:hypothetical protein